MRTNDLIARARGGARLAPLALCALVLPLVACDTDSIINLPDPDLITRPIVEDTANLPEIRNGVVYEFARAYAGPGGNNSTPGITGLSGLMTDELWYASTFPTMQEVDRRNIEDNNGDLLNEFRYLQRARNLAERAAALYESSPRANTPDHALVTNLAGFTYIFFAENFCSGVPFSVTEFTGAVEYGPPETTEQIFDRAIASFDAALAVAQAAGAAGAAQANVALVGKARALLGLGRLSDASTAVANVPNGFLYTVDYGDLPAPQNGLWYNVNAERRSSAASGEGANGIAFFKRGSTGVTTDPRTPADSGGVGIGTTVRHYRQQKYPEGRADIPLASGLEAQLIRAEALLNGGQSAGYLPILNALRPAGLPALTDPGSAQARVRQFFEERARWLWLTAHRLGDLRRMMRQYQFTEDAVFPTGQTIFGVAYGDDVNLPIPFAEANNPEFTGQCIDRDP
jgi:hypothetical protein